MLKKENLSQILKNPEEYISLFDFFEKSAMNKELLKKNFYEMFNSFESCLKLKIFSDILSLFEEDYKLGNENEKSLTNILFYLTPLIDQKSIIKVFKNEDLSVNFKTLFLYLFESYLTINEFKDSLDSLKENDHYSHHINILLQTESFKKYNLDFKEMLEIAELNQKRKYSNIELKKYFKKTKTPLIANKYNDPIIFLKLISVLMVDFEKKEDNEFIIKFYIDTMNKGILDIKERLMIFRDFEDILFKNKDVILKNSAFKNSIRISANIMSKLSIRRKQLTNLFLYLGFSVINGMDIKEIKKLQNKKNNNELINEETIKNYIKNPKKTNNNFNSNIIGDIFETRFINDFLMFLNEDTFFYLYSNYRIQMSNILSRDNSKLSEVDRIFALDLYELLDEEMILNKENKEKLFLLHKK